MPSRSQAESRNTTPWATTRQKTAASQQLQARTAVEKVLLSVYPCINLIRQPTSARTPRNRNNGETENASRPNRNGEAQRYEIKITEVTRGELISRADE